MWASSSLYSDQRNISIEENYARWMVYLHIEHCLLLHYDQTLAVEFCRLPVIDEES